MKQLCIFATLLMMGMSAVSCHRSELETETPADSATMVFSATVAAKTADTRAFLSNGETYWDKNEQIALHYQKNDDSFDTAIAYVGEPREDGSAPITATLTDAKDGSTVKFVYPARLMNTADGSLNPGAMANQHGTIADISANFDAATGSGTLVTHGTTCGINGQVEMINRALVGKMIPTFGNTNINRIIKLTISDGTNTYTVTPGPTYKYFDDQGIYVAMLPVDNQEVFITAQTITPTYSTGQSYGYGKIVSLMAGKLYTQLVIPMLNLVDLSTLDSDYIAQDGDFLSGELADNDLHISIAAGAKVTLSNVSISRQQDSNLDGITCQGNATILLGGSNTVIGSEAGLRAGPSNSILNIKGHGSLVAESNNKSAGIGSPSSGSCGSIIIQGGNIMAKGGQAAAGIGAGANGSCQMIQITSGNVNATSVDGPGIGAGCGGNGTTSSCGLIRINGNNANVTAMAGGTEFGGAGIGTSVTNSRCADIMIDKGTVVAKGCGGSYPGIGSAGRSAETNPSCGTITIGSAITKVTAINGNQQDSRYVCIGGNCSEVYWGDQKMYTRVNYSITIDGWNPQPENGGNYGGLFLLVTQTDTENDTWILSPVSD